MIKVVSSKLAKACVWGCVACFATVKAASGVGVQDSNPYTVISDRNIFHLNPPPPPPVEEVKPVELAKVALTGFVGKGDAVRVLLAIPPAKDSKDSSITYLTLAPGDRDHDVQLVKIHMEKEEVEILNSGTAQTLSRSNTLASLGTGPRPAGGPPGALGEHGIHRATLPGFTPPAPVAPTAARERGASSIVAGGRDEGSSRGAIVSGGGGYSGGYSGQALVGGGTSAQYANAGNNVGAQVANALFNPTTGHYQPSTPSGPALPREVQAAVMAVQSMSGQGGPPAPPEVQAAVDGLQNQGPPGIPGQ